MFKQLARFGVLAMFVTLGSDVWGIQERYSFDVSVTIPVPEAYVLPSEPDWMGREQVLAWDLAKSRLGNLRKHFDVKNINGGVSARLGEVPYLSNNGQGRIDLQVLFNRVPLTLDSTQVVTAQMAQVGTRAELEISPIEPSGGYSGGEYYGTVHLVFDFLAP